MTNTLEIKAPEHVLHYLNWEGDHQQLWNPDSEDEVDAAKGVFDSLRSKGFLGYRVDRKGKPTGEIMREFDPEAGKIVMRPPMAGG